MSARPGQAFAVPLGGGRYGLVWAVCPGEAPGEVLACAAAWWGSAPPADLKALEPLRPLQLTHPGAPGQLAAARVSGPPPAAWTPLGFLQGGPGVEASAKAEWGWFEGQLLRQSLWEMTRGPSAPAPPAAFAPSWAPLGEWRGVPRRYAEGARKALRQAAERLRKLGPKAPEPEREAALRACVEALNALQAKRPFIGDPERADLLKALAQLAEAGGLRGPADRGRTW